ncbi:MAG: hypothetical protein ACREJO_09140 [Phycisphaerales bacterium]
MAALLDWDWLFFAAGGLLGVAALWLLWRGLLADRSRGRARCPRCWYDLGSLVGLAAGGGRGEGASSPMFSPVTCPECGRVVKRERQMHRTRRRWRMVVAGVMVVVIAGGLALTPKVRRDGVWAVTPTWVMIGLVGVVDRSEWPTLDRAMRERIFDDGVSDAAVRALFLSDRNAIRFRSKWPRGVPLVLGGSGVASKDRISQAVLAINDQAFPGDFFPKYPEGFWDYSYEASWSDAAFKVGDPEAGLDYAIWVWPTTARRRISIKLPIEICDSVDQAITPVRGAAINTLVREGLQLRISHMPTSERAYLAARSIGTRELQGMVIAPHVEIRDGLEVVGRALWWQTPGRDSHVNGLPILIDGPATRLDALLRDPTNPRYTVRVRGDGEMALRDFDGSKYWAGEFTMPLSELIRPSVKAFEAGQPPQ